mmetsp:Transcript_65311/g.184323  ORF Transcript_65311/g.184323 Transcript_65311/m.184323 type:complete len:130 (-) Transcript_65311:18-407(-)
MVPSLGLGVFGVATSTCDNFGDGDSVAFPIVSALVPAVERALQARLMRKLEPPLFAGELAGRYCNTTLGIESFVWNPGAASGRGLVARGQKPGDYPFLLQGAAGKWRSHRRDPGCARPVRVRRLQARAS